VTFDEFERIKSISHFCESSYESIHGVGCGEEMPIERLKSYEVIQTSHFDGIRRTYCYPELQTCFGAQKARVDVITVKLASNM
jgi:hypothetical protein